jgi:hypothetical protein
MFKKLLPLLFLFAEFQVNATVITGVTIADVSSELTSIYSRAATMTIDDSCLC